ncbi:thioredoxin family protein, partial [Planctomicrobium sp.]
SQQEPSTSPFPPFSSNEDKAATSLQGDVQALHTDVKKLIELLEKRQAMKEKQATTEAQNEVVPQNGKTVLFFHADWGGPSQIMKSIVKKLHEDGISIVSVDIDEHPELMRRYKVDSIPTLLHIENGHPYPDSKKTGLMTEEGLRNYVRDYDPPIQMVEQSFSYSDFLTKNLVQISISEPVATNSDSLNSSPAMGSYSSDPMHSCIVSQQSKICVP